MTKGAVPPATLRRPSQVLDLSKPFVEAVPSRENAVSENEQQRIVRRIVYRRSTDDTTDLSILAATPTLRPARLATLQRTEVPSTCAHHSRADRAPRGPQRSKLTVPPGRALIPQGDPLRTVCRPCKRRAGRKRHSSMGCGWPAAA